MRRGVEGRGRLWTLSIVRRSVSRENSKRARIKVGHRRRGSAQGGQAGCRDNVVSKWSGGVSLSCRALRIGSSTVASFSPLVRKDADQTDSPLSLRRASVVAPEKAERASLRLGGWRRLGAGSSQGWGRWRRGGFGGGSAWLAERLAMVGGSQTLAHGFGEAEDDEALGKIEPAAVQELFPLAFAGLFQRLGVGEGFDQSPCTGTDPVVKGFQGGGIIFVQGLLELVDEGWACFDGSDFVAAKMCSSARIGSAAQRIRQAFPSTRNASARNQAWRRSVLFPLLHWPSR